MASAAVVLPELLAPEKRLTGPMSNSQFGTLPQLTNTNFFRNTLAPAARRRGSDEADPVAVLLTAKRATSRCRRPARRLDGIGADEIDDHRMNPQPRLGSLELLVAAIVDQTQLPQP